MANFLNLINFLTIYLYFDHKNKDVLKLWWRAFFRYELNSF